MANWWELPYYDEVEEVEVEETNWWELPLEEEEEEVLDVVAEEEEEVEEANWWELPLEEEVIQEDEPITTAPSNDWMDEAGDALGSTERPLPTVSDENVTAGIGESEVGLEGQPEVTEYRQDLLGGAAAGLTGGIAQAGKGLSWINKKIAGVTGSETLQRWAKDGYKYWDKVAEDNSVAEFDENPVDNPKLLLNPEWVVYQVGKQAPGMGATVAAGPLGPVAQMGMMGATMASAPAAEQYDEVLKSTGGDKIAAANAYGTSFVINTALDKLGLDYFWKPVGGAGKNVVMGFIGEGGTEYTQEFTDALQGDVQTWVSKGHSLPEITDKIGSKLHEYNKTGLGAALVGGPMGGTMGGLSGAPSQVEASKILEEVGVEPLQPAITNDQEILERTNWSNMPENQFKPSTAEEAAKVFEEAGTQPAEKVAERGEFLIENAPSLEQLQADKDYQAYEPELPPTTPIEIYEDGTVTGVQEKPQPEAIVEETTEPETQGILEPKQVEAATPQMEQPTEVRTITPEESAKVSEDIATDPTKQFQDQVAQKLMLSEAFQNKGNMEKAVQFRGEAIAAAEKLGVDLEGNPVQTKGGVSKGDDITLTATVEEAQSIVKDLDPKDAKAVQMTPDEFLNMSTSGSATVNRIKKEGFVEKGTGQEYDPDDKAAFEYDEGKAKKDIKPYLIVNKEGKVTGHDGRHRAVFGPQDQKMDVVVIYEGDTIPVQEITPQFRKKDSKPYVSPETKAKKEAISESTTPKAIVRREAIKSTNNQGGKRRRVVGDSILSKSPEDITISQPSTTKSRELGLVSAIHSGDGQVAITKALNEYPSGERKTALKKAVGLAVKESKAKGDGSIDQVLYDADEATKAIAGRKTIAGSVVMKKVANGMYTGTDPNTGSKWSITKTKWNEFQVQKDDKVVKIINSRKKDEAEAYVASRTGTDTSKAKSTESAYTIETLKKTDPRYNVEMDRVVTLDKDGNIVKLPNGKQGVRYKKQATGYVELLNKGQGKDFKAEDFVSKGNKIKASAPDTTTTTKKKSLKDKKPEAKVIKEISKAEEKAIIERLNAKRAKEAKANKLRELDIAQKAKADKKKTAEDILDEMDMITSLVHDDTNLQDAMEIVFSEAESDTNSKAIIGMLYKIMSPEKIANIKVRPARLSTTPKKAGSWYDFDEKTIYYQPGISPTTFAHEGIHAVTANEYRALPAGHSLKARIGTAFYAYEQHLLSEGLVTQDQIDQARSSSKTELAALIKSSKKGTRELIYSVTNEDEFFSMTLTHPAVRDIAKSAKLPDPTVKEKTSWDKVKNVIKEMLDVPKNFHSIFEEVLDITHGLAQIDITTQINSGTAEDFEQKRAKLKAARENTGKDGFIKGTATATKKAVKHYIRGIDGALGDIHKDLKDKLQKYNSNVMVKRLRRQEQVQPWIDQLNSLSIEDRDLYTDALYNYHNKVSRSQMEALHKSNPELSKAWNEAESVIKEISQEMIAQGLIPKSRKYYFPNKVDDLQGLMNTASKGETWTLMAEVQADLKKKFKKDPDPEKVKEVMKDMLSRGVYPAMLVKPGSAKAKSIWEVKPDMQQYYQDPTKALMVHIQEATESIEQRKMIGKSGIGKLEERLGKLKDKKTTTPAEDLEIARLEGLIVSQEQDLDNSVGTWLSSKAMEGVITPDNQALVRDLFMGVFHTQKMSKGMQGAKNISTAMALSQVLSAVTQLSDPGHTAAKYSWRETLQGILTSAVYTKEDIDAHTGLSEIGDEGKTQKFLESMLKVTGFTTMDSLFKKGVMNTAIISAKKMSRDQFVKKFGGVFDGKGEADQLYRDLKTQTKAQMSQNPQVKRFVFNELSEIQPITTSSMPLAYNQMKNGKLIYSLKSYNVKQMNNIYDRATEASDEAKTPAGKKAAAFYSVAKYAVMMTMLGAGADELKDLLMGRDIDHSETLIDNLFKLILLSKYSSGKMIEGGVSNFLGDFIMPNLSMVEAPMKDFYNNVLNGDRDPSWKTLTQIPIFGKLTHEWISPDALKRKARKRREKIFQMNKDIRSKNGSSKSRSKLRKLRHEYNKEAKGLGLKQIKIESLNRSYKRMKESERLKKKKPSKKKIGGFAVNLGPKEAVASMLEEESQEGFETKYAVSEVAKGYKEEAKVKTKKEVDTIRQSLRQEAKESGLTRQEIRDSYDEGTAKKSRLVELLGQPGVEGYKETLYTPGRLSQGDKSGITVGNGVDLGQQSIAKFKRLGISDKVIDKVTKLGLWQKRGEKAQKIMDDLSPSEKSIFTRAEVAEMSNKITAAGTSDLKKKLGSVFWNSITEDQQAVALSLYHIYGSDWYDHNSYKQLRTKDWKNLRKNMRDYKDKTPKFAKGINNRHKIMAKYI